MMLFFLLSFFRCYLCLFWFLGSLAHWVVYIIPDIRALIRDEQSRNQELNSRLFQAPLYIMTETSILSYKNRLQIRILLRCRICTINTNIVSFWITSSSNNTTASIYRLSTIINPDNNKCGRIY